MTHDRRILVVAAVRQELADFFKSHQLNSSGVPLGLATSFNSGPVDFLVTGMGSKRAYKKVCQALTAQQYKGVIMTGFAGGLTPGLNVGDLVMPSEVVDLVSKQRFKPSMHNRGLSGAASVGKWLTADQPIAEVHQKKQMGASFKAQSVDMETSAVAQAAREFSVPWTALRVILDPMETCLEVRSWPDALSAIVHPGRWGQLFRMRRRVRIAGHALNRGLSLLIESLMKSEFMSCLPVSSEQSHLDRLAQ